MSEYFIIDQELVTLNRPLTLGALPDNLDPLAFLQGKHVELGTSDIELPLKESSGEFTPDIISYLIPLFSDKIKQALDTGGVNNIEYHPVALKHPVSGHIFQYWLVNILDCIACLDATKSKVKWDEDLDTYKKLKSFVIDASKAGDKKLFRLAEKKTLIIIDESVKNQLDKADLKDVRIINTRDYDGF